MRIRALHFALFFICLGLFGVSDLNVRAQGDGPEVTSCTPTSGSIDSVFALQGYRLSPSEPGKTKVYFLQNSNKYPARTGGGLSTTNDERNGAQSLEVIVPEGLVPGPSQIVVEANGLRSAALPFSIVEWTLPQVARVTPASGSPGTLVDIACTGFHIYDEIELTDAQGKVTSFESGGSINGTGFRVPKDTPEGVMTIRIGNRKYGKNNYTEPFRFVVTNDPLPLELRTGFMTSVAPGQWIDLQASSLEPLKHSELTQVAFKQDGRTIVIEAPKPHQPHVGVPSALSPGEVQLQVRTWRDGRASAWSDPQSFRLLERPVPPSVESLRLEKSGWVHLWPGPDRAERFSATAGDLIVINGSFPVADASRLSVALVGPEGTIVLTPYELDDKADWFGTLCVKLPDSLNKGDWRMTVASTDDGTLVELPIIIKID